MSFWTWMRQAALILVGRNANGTNPRASSEYQAVAIDQTTRSLQTLQRVNAAGTEKTALADAGGILYGIPLGAASAPFSQDGGGRLIVELQGSAVAGLLMASNNALVTTPPGAIEPATNLFSVHLSNVANTVLFSAPGSQEFCFEQIIMANNNVLSVSATMSRSTAGNASRVFRGAVTASETRVFQGPVYVRGGKPLMGSASVGPGLTVSGEGYRTK